MKKSRLLNCIFLLLPFSCLIHEKDKKMLIYNFNIVSEPTLDNIKYACGKDSLSSISLSNEGLFEVTVYNLGFDTVYINLNNFLCNSIPIILPSDIYYYTLQNDTLAQDQYQCIFNGKSIQKITISKYESASFLISLEASHNDTTCIENFLLLDVDSSGVNKSYPLRIFSIKDSLLYHKPKR